MVTNVSEELIASFLKVNAVYSSRKLAASYQFTRCHNPEDYNMNPQGLWNYISRKFKLCILLIKTCTWHVPSHLYSEDTERFLLTVSVFRIMISCGWILVKSSSMKLRLRVYDFFDVSAHFKLCYSLSVRYHVLKPRHTTCAVILQLILNCCETLLLP